MSDHIDIVEELYGSRYKGNPLWDNVVKKLTVRQAYVFYYSLAYFEKNKTTTALGIFDLPDKTAVHKCLMDALQKEKNPNQAAQIIGDNVHKILINDNDLLWIKTELRAAIWLSYSMATFNHSNRKFFLSYLRSTSEAEFVNRLLHVIDIHGCSLRGDLAEIIRGAFDHNTYDLPIDHRTSFNNHQGNYVSNRIDDHFLNWLNKLPVDEVDAILERFKADEILVLVGIFVPVSKKDKIALVKASLDIRQYIYITSSADASLYPYGVKNDINTVTTNQSEEELDNINKKKNFAKLSAYEIINLLIKARRSREHRKIRSTTKNDRSLTLNKEAHSTLIKLSGQLNATPKKVIEALIEKVDLDNTYEVSAIDKLISGRRSVKEKSPLEKPIKQQESVKLEEAIEVEEPVELEEAIEVEEPIELEEAIKDLEIKPNQTNKRKRQRDALLNYNKR
ncbi:hypothetical protein [Psychrobacter sp. Cmf 22.2]|uniref:hypothetical protein n=1 Tax=Psychrobacter sp. Cmf 22.2 TaxID=1926478 RepID=UPI000946CD98|nr:hypothetical protein [Psychrobacter sp. Cmf 22.2]OLF36736.1 hypothetical protein BTV98_09990 [Psychrobacter sp. Cmf 22.2]